MSDIGGTAGLVLGLSIASVLKHMETFYFNKRDWLKEKISKRVKGWQYRNELSSKENFQCKAMCSIGCGTRFCIWLIDGLVDGLVNNGLVDDENSKDTK